jgi:hypothetical protein
VEVSSFSSSTLSIINAWFPIRKHVLSDLQPYICTHLECSLHEYLFRNQEEWWQHETLSHRLEWYCNTATHKPFQEVSAFLTHMKDCHGQSFPDNQVPSLGHVFQRPSRSQEGVCNLCGKRASKLKTHIAKHLQQLAIFAIPQTDYMAESGSEDVQSDKAHYGRAKSADSYHSSIVSKSETMTDNGQPLEEDLLLAPETLVELSTFPNSGIEKDTSWDFATRKFKDAREAMYHTDTPDMEGFQSVSLGNESNIQSKGLTGTNSVAPSPTWGMNPENVTGHMHVMNPYHQQRPMCGASISAYHRGEHSLPVSLGGVILVDGEPYGLTVHHLLDALSDDESDVGEDLTMKRPKLGKGDSNNGEPEEIPENEADQLTAKRSEVGIGDDEKEAKRDETSNAPRLLRQRTDQGDSPDMPWSLRFPEDFGGASPSGEADYREAAFEFSSDEFDSDDEDAHDIDDNIENGRSPTVGDIPGIPAGEGANIDVTQPAIYDVEEDFFASGKAMDEFHLAAHELGHIYASSGIRRWKRKGIVHEIDWALIKINPDRLQHYNVLQGGQRFRIDKRPRPPPLEDPIDRRHYKPEEDEYPMEVADADSLAGLNVHCFGRTTGLQGGKIGASMTNIKMFGRETFSRSWSVKGGCKS